MLECRFLQELQIPGFMSRWTALPLKLMELDGLMGSQTT